MAHFARINQQSKVEEVVVISNSDLQGLEYPESEPLGIQILQSIFGVDSVWKQTSYNGTFRYNFAGIGYTYDAANDAFIEPKKADDCYMIENFRWKCPSLEPPLNH